MAQFTQAAVDIIKKFEGYERQAYPDPGTGGDPWTIGYGHTGPEVHPFLTCTAAEAETWLIDDMDWANDAVNDYVRVDIWQSAHDALVSFVFNIGAGAFGDSTLVRRLNAGEPVGPVIEQELPRWINGGNGPMEGLIRRRDAEVELALSGQQESSGQNSLIGVISLVDAAQYYKAYEHQVEAFDYLQDLLTIEELEEFARRYRNENESGDRILDVRYYYQLDSVTPQGARMCFSSTCGMLVEYESPGTLSSYTGDDEYLSRVEEYGDTTDANAQVQALRSFDVDAAFTTSAGWEEIEDQITRGHPVPVGWLHYGSRSYPSGGGHWSLIIGLQGDDLIVHDPFGEADLINGGYVSNSITSGQAVRYSRQNFGPRWMVEGPGTGWMIQVS